MASLQGMFLFLACTSAPPQPGDSELDPDDSAQVDEDCERLPFWADADDDGYGAPESELEACLRPEGYVDNALDCDDGDPFVSPDGLEECNGIDDDCDGEVDPPEAYGAVDWWPDEDEDGWGDAEQPQRGCEVVEPSATRGEDCDDHDASVSPAAEESLDGRDEDCDGVADDGLPWGHGGDGALTLSGQDDLSDHGLVCSRVAHIDGDELELDEAAGFESGDRVLLIQMQGTPSSYASTGRFELLEVRERADRSLLLLEAPEGVYGDAGDLHAHAVSAFRVPQLSSLTVSGELGAPAWDGDCGGVLAVMVSGELDLQGRVDLSGAGYRGGELNSTEDTSGQAGESLRGVGPKTQKANGGGGGGGGLVAESCPDCEGGGAGGAHLGAAEDGSSGDSSKGKGGQAGVRTTTETNDKLLMGSAGGAGARDTSAELGNGGEGGHGGGMVLIWAASGSITGAIEAEGLDGGPGPADGGDAGAGGGGAGGSIAIWAGALDLEGELSVAGGAGGASVTGSGGGDAGDGRVLLVVD